jgi:hypothetical protein
MISLSNYVCGLVAVSALTVVPACPTSVSLFEADKLFPDSSVMTTM